MAAALASCSSSCIATVSPSSQLRVFTSRNASSSSMPQLRRFVANPPLRSISSQRLAVSSQLTTEENVKADGQQVVASMALAGALFATLADVGSAQAAQEVMQLATDDTRGYLLLLPLLVALGWVGFNILTPALNQIDRMRGAKGVAAGLGLGAAASLLVAPQADAAEEIMQLAASDNRAFILLVVLLPAVGWVLFNIAGPAANQWTKLVGGGSKKRSVAGALGLGGAASLLAPQADAAQEIMELAASDNRAFILLVVLFPALGWVLYNIGGPALNQVNKLRGLKSVAGAVGLGAVGSMVLAEQADAAEEIMQLAAGDNRAALLLVVLLPAVGWVLYNITGPALNQVNKLLNKGGKVGAKKK